MAVLGFSVLMREWRRGMAFDPWHGSLYLSLSTVITLSPSFPLFLSLSLLVIDGETDLHHWIWSSQSDTLNPLFFFQDLRIQASAAPLLSPESDRSPSPAPWQPISIGVDWSPGWKRKEKAEADLWKYYFICRALQRASLSVIMLQFHIICLSKPHKSLMVLQGSLAIVAAWHQAKDDKPQD